MEEHYEWTGYTGKECEVVWGDEDRPVGVIANDVDMVHELLRLAARVKELEVAWKASNDLLVRTTMMLGEIESTANRWLPYRVKELKIAVDMQVMSNARTRHALTKEQSVEPCKKSGGEE